MVSEGEVILHQQDECPVCGDSVGPCVYCARGRHVIAHRRFFFTEREKSPRVPNTDEHQPIS